MVAALSELAGVNEDDIEVFLDRDAFTLDYDPALVSLEQMYDAISELGYTPSITGQASETGDTLSGEVPEVIATALQAASTSNKLVFIDFYAPWCLACKVLEQNTLSDEIIEAALEGYVSVKVDTDADPQAGLFYQIVGMPTLLILDAQGAELYRNVGLVTVAELEQVLAQLSQR
ncbi:MAG: hypothetical protein COC19_07985 [SAR86 cluster bacterium]|uniref:Thioredoxin domain-containing protein n=1 Tax=SAR86 cluster bacterium TaxID=2030880 RepID=A0A2A4MFS3_9GAMM|nr:MAG: hypothetical protein COC19_07985 [SAR86 cluster bacterium]